MRGGVSIKSILNRGWRIVAIGIGIYACMLTSGCWDLKETQDRNFVLLVAVDDANIATKSESEKQKASIQTFAQKTGTKEYMLTLQILKLVKSESKEEGKASTKTYVISNTGKSLFEMVRDMLGQSSKSLYWEHLAAIVISEAAVKKQGLLPIIDFFHRDPEMRWRTKVFIAPGEAKAIAQFSPPNGETGGRYLDGMIRNHKKNIHVAGAKTDIGFISQAMDNGADYAVPRVDYEDNVLKIGGTALFKNNMLVGYADEYITQGIRFIYGTERSAVITAQCPGRPDEVVVFELFKNDTKLIPHIDGDNVYLTLDIAMRGNIGELNDVIKHDINDMEFLHLMEQAIAEVVARNVQDSWAFQQRLGVDIPNVKARFKGYHPFDWKKIEDRWEQIFPTIPLIVSVNVTIMGIGEHD